MSASSPGNAKYAALLKLAEAKFGAWLVEVQHPERERRTKELVRQHRNVGFSDRATYLLALEQKLLQTAVRKRITIYADVARKQNSLEMLSEPRLAELRERNMTLVRGSLTALKGLLGRAGNAVGAADSAFPAELMYVQIEAKLLDVVTRACSAAQKAGTSMPRPAGTPSTIFTKACPAARKPGRTERNQIT